MSGYALFARGNPTGGSFGSSYPCYAFKNIGSHSEEIWLTSRVSFPNPTSPYRITSQQPGTNGFAGQIQTIFTGSDGGDFYLAETPVWLEGVSYDDDFTRWEEVSLGYLLHTDNPPLQYQKWYTLESHYHASSSRGSIVHCDGSWSHTFTPYTPNQIAVGCFFPRTGFFLQGLYDCFEVVVDHVKVGTTRKGNDIFEDDFSSGDLSAWSGRRYAGWTGTEHDPSIGFGVTVIDRPSFPNYNELCPIEVVDMGVYLAPVTIPYGNVPVGQIG